MYPAHKSDRIFVSKPVITGSLSHHGMARPQAADGGMASNMQGRCEYIEIVVADTRQGVILQLGGWVNC